VDASKISASERLAAGGGVVLLIGLFLKWYGFSLSSAVTGLLSAHGVSTSISGWHSVTSLRWLLLITALLAIGLALAKAYGKTVSLPIAPSVLLTGLGGLSVVWIVWRLLDHPAPHLSVKLGLFVSLVGAVVLTVGGRQLMTETGASFEEVRERVKGMTSSAEPRKPPGPQ
jgi:hypothetical protein